MHKWVMSFDLNSLYPHLIMQYNISPETVNKDKRQVQKMTVDKLLVTRCRYVFMRKDN